MPIKILSPEVASQIAAGEVVERPASVVKELIENALDAGASHISIEVENAGRKLMEVSDDGVGIPKNELALSISRHATSKLQNAADLYRISTLGFRGEALSSIASVSKFTLTSRTEKAHTAGRLQVDAGQPGVVSSIGAPQGTVVRVEDLFYNVPAQLEFLKKDTTERRHINLIVTRYALAYPHVRFHLTQEGKSSLQTGGEGDRRAILASMYSPDIARQMLEVIAQYDNYVVEGYSSPTSLTRASRRDISFFVNGRWVQDAALSAAVVQAYRTMLMVGRYPLTVLFLQIPPDEVDVNVHPTKSEVRFRKPDRVFSGVQRAVRHALLAHTPVPELDPHIRWAPHQMEDIGADKSEMAWESNLPSASPDAEYTSTSDPPGESGPPLNVAIPLLRLVGQIGAAYLVAEGPDGLYLVDQHAAHERILFERFMSQRQSDIPSQSLLEPVTVELSTEEVQLLTEQLPMMEKLGFQVESFGPNAFKIRSMPALLLGSDPEAALRVVVEDFEEDESPLQAEIETKIIARVCKRAAVKAGQVLSVDEQRVLLADLEACQSPRTCPHGRPTMVHLSIDLLERQFGRKGAR
jgi:DNA mismatch repair protein MutL